MKKILFLLALFTCSCYAAHNELSKKNFSWWRIPSSGTNRELFTTLREQNLEDMVDSAATTINRTWEHICENNPILQEDRRDKTPEELYNELHVSVNDQHNIPVRFKALDYAPLINGQPAINKAALRSFLNSQIIYISGKIKIPQNAITIAEELENTMTDLYLKAQQNEEEQKLLVTHELLPEEQLVLVFSPEQLGRFQNADSIGLFFSELEKHKQSPIALAVAASQAPMIIGAFMIPNSPDESESLNPTQERLRRLRAKKAAQADKADKK